MGVRRCCWPKGWQCCSSVLRAERLLLAPAVQRWTGAWLVLRAAWLLLAPAGGLACVFGLVLRAAGAVVGAGGRVCVDVEHPHLRVREPGLQHALVWHPDQEFPPASRAWSRRSTTTCRNAGSEEKAFHHVIAHHSVWFPWLAAT